MKLLIERKPRTAAGFFVLKALFVFAAIFFAAESLWAQSEGAGPSLEQVSAALAQNKTVRGDFALERSAANKSRVLKSSGKFVIASDYGIIWKSEKPIKSVQVVAKEFSLTEAASGRRTKIDGRQNPVYLQMALLTSALWTGNLEAVQSAASLNFVSDENSWSLELFPKDKAVQMALEKIRVAGTWSAAAGGKALSNAEVNLMEMNLQGGNSARYYMSGHKYDLPLTSAELSYFE
ncbi:MAG: outer membrane lipoprotein carrier protein LolA [Treponema sp.]|nr:outer membrane lipoprotein carrier protein LolA [Treponema sp.]